MLYAIVIATVGTMGVLAGLNGCVFGSLVATGIIVALVIEQAVRMD
jgi:hypothetical protein